MNLKKVFSTWWVSYEDGMKPVLADKHPCYCSIRPKNVVWKKGIHRKETLKTWISRKKIVVAFILGDYSVKKRFVQLCSSSPSLFFFFFFFLLSNVSFPSAYFSLCCYRWPVDTFISVELLTGWVWHGSGRRRPLLNLFGNLSWTAKISLPCFLI